MSVKAAKRCRQQRCQTSRSETPQAGGNPLRATPFAPFPLLAIKDKEALQKTAIEYTYPQLLIQNSATRPGSILDRQGGSIFKRHRHPGTINGKSVRFLVNTGAPGVTAGEAFARDAGLSGGESAVFSTANGKLNGRVVKGVTVQLGPLEASDVHVAVGLVGLEADQTLLGQNFLSKFDILEQHNQMTLRKGG